MKIRIKRIYEPSSDEDGFRVLVDRLWPRGMKKEAARIDAWAKDLAPTASLRKWFHRNKGFEEFRSLYLRELDNRDREIDELFEKAGVRTITLLFAARDRTRNHAAILREFLLRH